MSRTIGIDLGTTNTVIAVFDKGRPKVLEDEKGYTVLPSVVSQREDGSYIVGQAAKNRILTHTDTTVYAVKRLIGRRFDSDEAQDAVRRMPYDVVEGPDGSAHLLMGDTEMSPVEVCSIILKVARQVAERALEESVEEAVITVPAYFNHQQRRATMEAAALAGLRCDRLLNEPTAAALAYGHRKDIERNIVIFDLGGGTFDVSVMHLSSGVYEVLATSGDTYLGGEDFDLRIIDWLADKFLADHRIDLREDSTSLQRLRDAAERAKCELSFTDKGTILIPRITADENLEYELTRSQLEQLVSDLIDRTIDITRDALSMAGLQLRDADDVVLVGGQTRMPRVREAITALFGKAPSRSVHPEEVVGLGAAVHGQSLDNPESSNTLLIDVTPFDLGIDSAGGFFSSIIERNTRIPFTRTRTFTTATENQERVRITVRQGASQVAKQNEFLGEFVLEGLRAAGRMEQKLDVTFRIDANGILHTSCVDRLTGERKQLVIERYRDASNEPKMPDEEEMHVDEERRARLRRALSTGLDEAPLDREIRVPEKSGGMLSSLLSRKSSKKPSPAKEAPASEPDDEPVELEPVELEALEPEALDEEALHPEATEVQPDPEPLSVEVEPEPLSVEVEPLYVGLEDLTEDDSYPDVATVNMGDSGGGESPRITMPRPPMVEEETAGDSDSYDDLLDDIEELREGPATLNAEGLTPPQPLDDPLDDLGDPFADDLFDDDSKRDLGLDDLGDLDGSGPDEEADETERPALLEEDLFYAEDLFADDAAPAEAEEAPKPVEKKARKPAKLKISYRTSRAFVKEYRQNLDDGQTFIKAEKPLKEGRECLFEITVPELEESLQLRGVVTWSSRKRTLGPGEEAGMYIEYQLDPGEREQVEDVLSKLSG